ncbi:uncharacterized mitochondrial protein-like protein [Tanacetum coccineum]
MNVQKCQCLELKTELLNKKDFVDKETYEKLCKSFTTLEKHCITLEADSQLNQENFQLENSVLNQNAPSFTQLFELSELRAQSQAKDTVIVKLKEQIKSLNGNVDDRTVKMDMDEIETLNIELEHRVTKLEQGLVIAALKNELRKLKGKALDKEATVTHSVDPKVAKDNMEPITPKLYTKVIQDLLSHISRTCPSINNFDHQLVAVTPRKKDKKVSDDCMSSDNLCVSNSMNDVKFRAKPKKSSVDPTMFIRREGKELLLVQIYVDDIIFAASTPELCDLFAKIMCLKFKMSMMGKISFFLGLQISQSPRGIFINQSKYALESLKKYGYESCDPVDTPMVEKSKLDEDKWYVFNYTYLLPLKTS